MISILNRIRAGLLVRALLILLFVAVTSLWSAPLVEARDRNVSECKDAGEADDVNGIKVLAAPQIGNKSYSAPREYAVIERNVSAAAVVVQIQMWRIGPIWFLLHR